MSHKLGTIVCKGARYGVVTKEARLVKYGHYQHEQNMIEVTWTNGKLKGKTQDIWSWQVDNAALVSAELKVKYERREKALAQARADAAKLVP